MIKNKAIISSIIAICIWLFVGYLVRSNNWVKENILLKAFYSLTNNEIMPYYIILALIMGVFSGSLAYYIKKNKRKMSTRSFKDYDFEDTEDPSYGNMIHIVDPRLRGDDVSIDTLLTNTDQTHNTKIDSTDDYMIKDLSDE